MLKSIITNESGSIYVEYALLIIGVVLVVSSNMFDLGNTTSDKIGELETEIGSVGTP